MDRARVLMHARLEAGQALVPFFTVSAVVQNRELLPQLVSECAGVWWCLVSGAGVRAARIGETVEGRSIPYARPIGWAYKNW